jgi:hypothetical protein
LPDAAVRVFVLPAHETTLGENNMTEGTNPMDQDLTDRRRANNPIAIVSRGREILPSGGQLIWL